MKPVLRRAGLALVALAAALWSKPGACENAPAPRWDPGRRVTSRLRDEIQAPDEHPATDGTYGRFKGDLDLGLGLGAELSDAPARGAARVSLHYFYTAGLYFTYRDRLGDGGELRRVLSVGIDMRPLFVPRWAKNMQQGPSVLDLTLDSLSLGLGAFWDQPQRGEFGEQRGFETSLGFGVPLLGQAPGPWLESRAQLAFLGTDSARAQFLLLLGFHTFFASPLTRTQ